MGQLVPENTYLFRNCTLFKEGRTGMAEQLAGNNMNFVEDMAPTAVPSTTDERFGTGAKKFEQVGPSACSKMIDSLIDGIAIEAKSAVVIIDFHLGVGDFLTAWLAKKPSLSCPSFFVGCTDDSVVKDWVLCNCKEKIAKAHMAGEFVIPGVANISPELPPDLVQEPPKQPTLNVLVAGGPDKLHPIFPEKLIKVLDDDDDDKDDNDNDDDDDMMSLWLSLSPM